MIEGANVSFTHKGLHIDLNSSVHSSHAPFPAVCIWAGGQQAACCFHRQGSAWLACSLLLWHFPSLSQVPELPSFRRESCTVMQKQDRKVSILIALKTQLLYESLAVWSPEPSFALLGACGARLSRDAYGCALPALAWGSLGAERGLQMFVLWWELRLQGQPTVTNRRWAF